MQLKLLLLLSVSFLSMQSQLVLKLQLIEGADKSVKNAVAQYGRKTFLSDVQGYVIIPDYRENRSVTIKYAGFRDTTVSFLRASEATDTITGSLTLNRKIFLLDDVPVYSSRLEEVNPQKADFILDYELKDGHMVQLLSENILLLLKEGIEEQTLSSLAGTKNLAKDPYGNIHVVSDHFSNKIEIEDLPELRLKIDTTLVAIDKFNQVLNYCEAVTDNTIFIRKYKDENQTLAFFSYKDSVYTLIREITNEERKQAVFMKRDSTKKQLLYLAGMYSDNLAGEMGEMGQSELRKRRDAQQMIWKQQMIYSRPAYNLLRVINDRVYIFAHDLDSMLVFTKDGTRTAAYPIDYHRLKMWNNEIIVNEEKTKAFGKFKSNAATLLAEIDLSTGQIKLPFHTIESAYPPKKIRIRNNTVYYMAKQKDGSGNTVYAQILKQPELSYAPSPDSLRRMEARTYLKRGLVELAKHDQAKATKYMEKAIKLNPEMWEAWLQKGIIYSKQKYYKKAIACYDKSISANKSNGISYYSRAVAYAALKEHAKALSDYEAAVVNSPNNAGFHLGFGNYLMDVKKFDKAEFYFSKAIQMDSTLWQAYYKRGVLFFRVGRIAEAIEDFNSALHYNNRDKLIYLKRGMAFDELKMHERAIDDFSAAISLDADYAEAYVFKGNSLMEAGKFELALLDFDFVLQRDPANFTARYNRATCKYLLKNYADAISDYSFSLRLKPTHAKAFYFRAMAELSLGMKSDACSDFKKAGNILDAKEQARLVCR